MDTKKPKPKQPKMKSFRMRDEEAYQRFRGACALHGTTVQFQLTKLLKEWTDKELKKYNENNQAKAG